MERKTEPPVQVSLLGKVMDAGLEAGDVNALCPLAGRLPGRSQRGLGQQNQLHESPDNSWLRACVSGLAWDQVPRPLAAD